MSRYPNAFYRVSVKAVIKNEAGQVLVCKEYADGDWSLPGGGVDHGEEPLDAMKRELDEELGIDSFTDARPVTVLTIYIEENDTWLMWIVYEITLSHHNFKAGKDVTDIAFFDQDYFETVTNRAGQLVNKSLQALELLD